jgi:hypothetical protein
MQMRKVRTQRRIVLRPWFWFGYEEGSVPRLVDKVWFSLLKFIGLRNRFYVINIPWKRETTHKKSEHLKKSMLKLMSGLDNGKRKLARKLLN